ncbi:MAG: hypothetical protein ACYC2H_02685 [Thermoplasmatota archaeon]
MIAMMVQSTTIPIDPAVRDRLRGFGKAGMNYSQIITAVLDKIEMEKFLAEMQKVLDDPDTVWIDYDDVKWD